MVNNCVCSYVICVLVLLSTCAQAATKPVIVPQLGYAGNCATMQWRAGSQTAVGVFSYPTPILVNWDTSTWTTKSYLPLVKDYCDNVLVVSPDSKYVIGTIYNIENNLIDVGTGRVIRALPLGAYVFSPDSKLMVQSSPGMIRIMHVPDGKLVKAIKLHDNGSQCVALSPNNRLVVTFGKKAQVWNLLTGRLVWTLKHKAKLLEPAVFSSDGRYLACAGEEIGWKAPGYAATESAYYRGRDILLWDMHNGRMVFRQAAIMDIEPSIDALFFMSGGHRLLSCQSGFATMWSIPGGKRLYELARDGKREALKYPQNPHDSCETFHGPYAISRDEKTLAAGNERFSLISFKQTATIPRYIAGSGAMAFSSDGTKLGICSDALEYVIWDMTTLAPLSQCESYYGPAADMTLSFTKSGKFHIDMPQGSSELLSVADGKITREPIRHNKEWRQLSPDCKKAVSFIAIHRGSSFKYNFKIWDCESETLLWSLDRQVLEGIFSADGRWYAGYAPQESTVIDTESGECHPLTNIELPFAISPVAPIVAGTDIKSGPNRHVVLINFLTGCRTVLKGTVREPLGRPAFSPDGKLIAVPFYQDVKIFRTNTGQCVGNIRPGGLVRFVAFHPNGKLLAIDHGPETQLWSVQDFKLVITLLSVGRDLQVDGGIDWWLAYTSEGWYTGSSGVEDKIKWRVSGRFLPGTELAPQFFRPDIVRNLLN